MLQDNRNLTDVFNELKQAKSQYEEQNSKKHKLFKPKNSNRTKPSLINTINFKSKKFAGQALVLMLAIFITIIAFIPKNNILATYTETGVQPKKEEERIITDFESNSNKFSVEQIVVENIQVVTAKEIVQEERDVPFETTYKDDPNLPKDEKVVAQEGKVGKANITAVKTYENQELIEEIITESEELEASVPEVVNVGTSAFLAKHKVHLGDIMYLTSKVNIKESNLETSKDLGEVDKNLDIILISAADDWCKVTFDGLEGYVKSSTLTSSASTPTIVEENRIQRILSKLALDMPLNKTSGLALKDFKKVLTGLTSDTNKILENNSEAFYNAEQKYKVNGIFLAALAIHESAWGTSNIANDKKNLFGYGAYDSDPYNGAYEFEDYKDGIELVAKVFAKYYLNTAGTKIYDNEVATATYYNEPTLAGINVRYSTDSSWHTKVYKYMETLYNRL